jgi:FkbM family methyltransferase
VSESPFKRFTRALARPVTSPVDGRVADINRRLSTVDDHIALLAEQLAELQRESAANATTIAEANTYAGVELRRFGESLDSLQDDVAARQRRLDEQLQALHERSYAERLANSQRPPVRSALDHGMQLERPLALADVGCRWGIPEGWQGRGADLLVYAFDADAQECERLQAQAPEGVTYVPLALGEQARGATLHITADPGCSSLFRPDRDALETFRELASSAPVDQQEVSLQTLDDWAAASAVESIDVMKLDVQGAELAVLEGAERLLRDVRLIELEVTFNRIYEGQPLFGEVDSYMRDHGFVLWRLTHLVHYATDAQKDVDVKRVDRQFFDRALIDFPVGAGQLTWAHAYYCVPELIRGGWSDAHAALRDACAAELFGFQELVQPALEAARAHTRGGLDGSETARPLESA